MSKTNLSRREFVKKNSMAGLGAAVAMGAAPTLMANCATDTGTPAVLGGQKIRTKGWPEWPMWDPATDEEQLMKVIRSGVWSRAGVVTEFEKKWAELIGAKRCLAVVNGTNALIASLVQLGIGGGDEVLVPPYTFIATTASILQAGAMPVFVDTDPETFLMDPAKIEEKITDRTVAIVPVHIYGLPVDMDGVNKVAKAHNLKVIEDACQAWLAEYRGRKTGTLGDLGCFSFQNSKHIPAGEGGAILGNDDDVMDRANSIHNCGRPYGKMKPVSGYPYRGGNFRMQQSQALILLSQMKRIIADNDKRLENALYLDKKLKEIPGIIPVKPASGATRAVYHLYPFRYKKEIFNNVPKEKFINALVAEGIPATGGYGKQNKDLLFEEAFNSRGYKRLFPEARLKKWRDENSLPGNDQVCDEVVTIYQSNLLGSRQDMDDIVNAVAKVYENRAELAKS